MLQKVNSLKDEAEEIIKEISYHMRSIITHVESQALSTQKSLQLFISFCEDLVSKISSFPSTLPEKQFCPPLESLLLNENPQISDLKGPELSIQDSYSNPFRLQIPTLAHLCSAYNYIVTIANTDLQVQRPSYSNTFQTLAANIDPTSRWLPVAEDTVMFTGGTKWENLCGSVNFRYETSELLAKMNEGRYKHCMAWINGFPAVMGGISSENNSLLLDSVEIFQGQWKLHSRMNYTRCNLTAVNCIDRVYVMGGNSAYDSDSLVDIIETFRESWEVIQVRLPEPCSNVGMIGIGGEILLFGGKNNKKLGDIIRFDIGSGECNALAITGSIFFKNNTLMIDAFTVRGSCINMKKGDSRYQIEFDALSNQVLLKR